MNELSDQLIRINNKLVKKTMTFNVYQQKIFYIILTAIKLGKIKKNVVEIEKDSIFEFLNFKSGNRFSKLKKECMEMAKKSQLIFDNEDKAIYTNLFTDVYVDRKKLIVIINEKNIDLLVNFAKNYTMFFNTDLISFNSKFSMMLFQRLMLLKEKRNCLKLTTKTLKDIFDLEEKSYVSKNGNFQRTTFENKVLNVAIDEINNKSKCISNLKYVKSKDKNIVKYYIFTFDYKDPREVYDDIKNYKINNEFYDEDFYSKIDDDINF